ncbi:MAG: SPOR domain-containing protein [Burkholderiaceae bacterium]|nr:SPOR domain-containing protein [Burkholderiaceae bacterium]
MKLVFLLLVLANLLLFAWQQGAFGRLPDGGREPERVARQIEPERVRVLLPDELTALREKAREAASLPSAAARELAAAGCVELGDFTQENAPRVRQRLDALGLSDRVTVRTVEAPGWYMVYVPPFKSRAEVERAAADLRRLGVKDLLVIGEESPLRFGIALGSFRDPELAKRHASELAQRGVKGVRVADKPSTVAMARFVIRPADPALAETLRTLAQDLNATRLQACAA